MRIAEAMHPNSFADGQVCYRLNRVPKHLSAEQRSQYWLVQPGMDDTAI